jgi:putative nucleotidyltransferase with HDIG domain
MALTFLQKEALNILHSLTKDSALAYLVGGWVRDTLLGKNSDDLDLVLLAKPLEAIALSRRFAHKATAKPVREALGNWQVDLFVMHEETGTCRVIFKDRQGESFYLDIMAMDGENLHDDAYRRDFTVNALIAPLDTLAGNNFELTTNLILDQVGGLNDLAAQTIRPISEQNLIADPLRILRGIRQRASLSQLSPTKREWTFADGTVEMFTRHVPKIDNVAAERIKVELDKTLLAGHTGHNLYLLDQIGMLTHLIPELAEGKDCSQMPAHYYDVFDHSLATVDRLEWLLRPDQYRGEGLAVLSQVPRPETLITQWSDITNRLFADNRERELTLLWGALLHDIGKPLTKTIDQEGQIHFYNHNKVGAKMAKNIMERLKSGNQQTNQVITMVQNHLRIGQLGEFFDPVSREGLSKRAIYRFFRDTEPVQVEMLPLALADHAAVVGNTIATARQIRSWVRHLALTDSFARNLLGTEEERIVGKTRLVDGKQLMQEFNLPPSPQIGYLLREIEEAQAIGQISTTQEALALAKTLL